LTDFCFSEINSDNENDRFALFSIGTDHHIIRHCLKNDEFGWNKKYDKIIVKQTRIEWDFIPKSITS